MNREQILTSIRRKSSEILKKELTENISLEEKELIKLVLRQRGVLERNQQTPILQPTPEQLNKLDIIITKICECDNDDLKSQVGEVLETVEEYSDLSLEQVQRVEKLWEVYLNRKTTSLSIEQSKEIKSIDFLVSQLSEKKITKKFLVESCIKLNIDRRVLSSLLPKGLIDSTYIYDLYKFFQK